MPVGFYTSGWTPPVHNLRAGELEWPGLGRREPVEEGAGVVGEPVGRATPPGCYRTVSALRCRREAPPRWTRRPGTTSCWFLTPIQPTVSAFTATLVPLVLYLRARRPRPRRLTTTTTTPETAPGISPSRPRPCSRGPGRRGSRRRSSVCRVLRRSVRSALPRTAGCSPVPGHSVRGGHQPRRCARQAGPLRAGASHGVRWARRLSGSDANSLMHNAIHHEFPHFRRQASEIRTEPGHSHHKLRVPRWVLVSLENLFTIHDIKTDLGAPVMKMGFD